MTQTPDTRPGFYFVTGLEQGGRPDRQRTAWLAGPFDTHAEALHHVPRCRELACKHYAAQGAEWLAYGTARIAREHVGALPKTIYGQMMGDLEAARVAT